MLNRTHLDLPAIVILAILVVIVLWIKLFSTIKLGRTKELSSSVRAMFVLRNAALLMFLGIALVGFLWPQLWNQQEVDLTAGIAWFVCWAALTVALQVALKRQRNLQKRLRVEAKTP